MKKTITILLLFLATIGSHAQFTAIPDWDFEQVLIANGYDDISDGQVLTGSISSVTSLYLPGSNIQSLEGIEDFTSLQYLNCSNNQLTTLNINGLTNLEYLNCSDNQLTSLDLTGLTNIQDLTCASNQISTLDVSALTNLQSFSFQNNLLTSIDLSGLNNLTVFHCGNNQLTSLNLTGLNSLQELYCNNNYLTTIDVSGLNNLRKLYCYRNLLTFLDASNLPNLRDLICERNFITSLNLTGLPNLQYLNCSTNLLTALNLNGLNNLIHFTCAFNQLSSLNLSVLNSIEYVSCDDNQLTSLNVSGLITLTQLHTRNNQLPSLNVTGLTSLFTIWCNNNQLTTLNISGLTNLTYVVCNNNQINNINLSGLTTLMELTCHNNQLTSLNLSGFVNLYNLRCNSNSALTCIQVNNVAAANANSSWIKDASASYALTCGGTANPNITPVFAPIASICSGETLLPLPATSTNGITGSWSPALNNTTTTTYTFTPAAGQSAATTTLTITVNPSVTPTFNQVAAICSGDTLAALPATSTNGITGTWSPALNNLATTTYTFTPATGQCAATTTLTITVNPSITPTFTAVAPICSGETLLPLPTTSTNGITGTWSPALNNLATTIYTFTPATGQCAATTTLTITVNPSVTPTFTAVAPICSGDLLAALPITSTNGITGTWSPALNNLATTTYTFTPATGQCAATTTLTITVNPSATPNFTAVDSICSGQLLAALPTTSTNGITGTWSPALNNWATTTYTFTPTTGQCATSTTMTIVVTPVVLPNFTPIAPICQGSTLTALPTTSTNGITGTWSPAVNNMATTIYIFTPAVGQCAKKVEMIIKVLPNNTPTFNQVLPICIGKTLAPLPTTSLNGYTGTWSPALNNTVTTTYTFTPTVGQCAVPVTMTIVVNQPTVAGAVTGGTTICRASTSGVLTLSGHVGTIVRWESSTNNFVTTTVIPNTTTTHVSGPITLPTQFRAVVQGVCGQSSSTSTTVTPVVVLSPAALRLTDNAISPLIAITNVSRYIGTSVPLTLTATLVSGATSYEWELPAGVNQLSGGTSNTITIDFAGVPAGVTSLYLGVKARNGDCVSTRNNSSLIPTTSSTARLLRVRANVPATPSTLKLTNDAISTTVSINNISTYVGTTTPLTLTANVSVNANSYDWELPAGVTQLTGGNTNIITVNFAGVGPGVTSLYLGVKARNGVGVSIRNNSSLVPATTSTARLLKVSARVPRTVASVTGQIVGICGGSTYNYAITPSVLATSYIITAPAGSIVTSVSNTLNLTNTLSTSDLMFSVSYPTNLATLTPKTLVITAVNGVGSNLTDRTLNISTTMPSIGAPTGSNGITTFQRCNTQTFSVPPVVGATSYIWEVVNGAVIVGTSNTNTVEIDFSIVPIFSTINLVKVKAVNACGVFSNVRNITLSSVPCVVLRSATQEIENTYNDGKLMDDVNIYPNPTAGPFNLELETLAEGKVDVEIYSSNAELVKASKELQLEKGTNTIKLDISNFASGVYIVRITNTNTAEVVLKRIVKQ